MKKPELLAPAGNPEKLRMALLYGADAVYLGGKAFGLRAFGGNFSREELAEGVAFAHAMGKKVYVTVNIIPHNGDLEDLPDYLRFLSRAGVDALLVADLGVFMMAREIVPRMELHVSTQANNTNWATVNSWQKLGAKRVVLARELSMEEVREIRRRSSAELEMFVHGAMCISYSGRCLMSNYFTGRDANRGSCAQACRWRYHLVEEKRPGRYMPVLEDERGTYIFNSKDLCLLPHIGAVMKMGLDSLKIEGRMKSAHYVASVVKAYRMAMDACASEGENFKVRKEWLEELEKVSHRPYTTGFFFRKPTGEDQIYGTSSYVQWADFVGLVSEYDETTGLAVVEQRNHMKLGEVLEVFQPTGETFRQELREMYDEGGASIEAAPHPQQIVRMRMEKPVEPFSILRREIPEDETERSK